MQNYQCFIGNLIFSPSTEKVGYYDFIEFFSERKFNKNNPIWSEKGISQYKYLTKRNNLKTYTFCDDYLQNNSILRKKSLIYL